MRRYLHVVGTRPNLVKAAPVIREMSARGFDQLVIHSGQHYDANLTSEIEKDLDFPAPFSRIQLESNSPMLQIGEISKKISDFAVLNNCASVIVYGDVTTTLAGALAAKYAELECIHVEAGLRSFDRSMPEEINRILVDSISDEKFVTTIEGRSNLIREGHVETSVHFVGNTMVDSLFRILDFPNQTTRSKLHGLVTIHRKSNVDNPQRLGQILDSLITVSERHELIWPLHPRTRGQLVATGLIDRLTSANIRIENPLGYREFADLLATAKFVITDSGGIQEEAAVLGVPTFILRENTERQVALESGRVSLVDPAELASGLAFLPEDRSVSKIPLWDGKAAKRIVDLLKKE